MTYTPPEFYKSAFNCPSCAAYAKQIWTEVHLTNRSENYSAGIGDILFAVCDHCNSYSIWRINSNDRRMIYPYSGNAPLPNSDMPDDVKADYIEARSIVNISPRGAAALLRLAIQKLCRILGASGENINQDIAFLVANGLPEKLQRALDNIRVVGNNAVHPGQIDFSDGPDIANKLFVFINIICDNQITQPNLINEFYDEVIPETSRDQITRRDNRPN
ncbi:DUF4145 domain-containing protein [Chitinophaga sp. ARDCPP14]|uniref:DUF4145 domain-containing protein n=1 Tax=Chitinophaga sp. ARDCPP14 TaxID=3391139 RepID=UPI003F5268D1